MNSGSNEQKPPDTNATRQEQQAGSTSPDKRRIPMRIAYRVAAGGCGQLVTLCLYTFFSQKPAVPVGLVRLVLYLFIVFTFIFLDGVAFILFRKSFVDRLLSIKAKKQSAGPAAATEPNGKRTGGIIRFLPAIACAVLLILVGIGIGLSGNDTALIVGEWHSLPENALVWTFCEDGSGTVSTTENGAADLREFKWAADGSHLTISVSLLEINQSFPGYTRDVSYRYTVTDSKLVLEKETDKTIDDLLGASLGKSQMTLYKEEGS